MTLKPLLTRGCCKLVDGCFSDVEVTCYYFINTIMNILLLVNKKLPIGFKKLLAYSYKFLIQ